VRARVAAEEPKITLRASHVPTKKNTVAERRQQQQQRELVCWRRSWTLAVCGLCRDVTDGALLFSDNNGHGLFDGSVYGYGTSDRRRPGTIFIDAL